MEAGDRVAAKFGPAASLIAGGVAAAAAALMVHGLSIALTFLIFAQPARRQDIQVA